MISEKIFQLSNYIMFATIITLKMVTH